MKAVVSPGFISGSYTPPPSKSHFQRLCAAALLREGTTEIQNPGRSADDAAALSIVEDLGAQVEKTESGIRITSTGAVKAQTGVINCGESGLCARLFAPLAALAAEPVEIRGAGSLLSRPMQPVIDGLRSLGVAVSSRDGCLPLAVQGPVLPADITVDGSLSSQVVSGLLFALAASATKPVVLRAESLVSRPYLAMSCAVLQKMGWDVTFDSIEHCFIEPRKPAEPYIINITTEADWSSIASIAVAAAFGGPGIEIDARRSEFQADSMILNIMEQAGAQIDELSYRESVVITPAPLRAFQANCTHAPDLIPILTILATACHGTSSIEGLHRLTYKESDRTETTAALLGALGISYCIEKDTFLITGPQTPHGGTVSGANDHRIVMAAAIAALRADGQVTIEGAEAVRKSYPDFFNDLARLNVNLRIEE